MYSLKILPVLYPCPPSTVCWNLVSFLHIPSHFLQNHLWSHSKGPQMPSLSQFLATSLLQLLWQHKHELLNKITMNYIIAKSSMRKPHDSSKSREQCDFLPALWWETSKLITGSLLFPKIRKHNLGQIIEQLSYRYSTITLYLFF
jgi:hypothetical protein